MDKQGNGLHLIFEQNIGPSAAIKVWEELPKGQKPTYTVGLEFWANGEMASCTRKILRKQPASYIRKIGEALIASVE